MKIESTHYNAKIQRLVISFADDSEFVKNGEDWDMKIRKITDTHAELYQDTGGKVQLDKVEMFSFQWTENGITNKPIVVKIGEDEIGLLDSKKAQKHQKHVQVQV